MAYMPCLKSHGEADEDTEVEPESTTLGSEDHCAIDLTLEVEATETGLGAVLATGHAPPSPTSHHCQQTLCHLGVVFTTWTTDAPPCALSQSPSKLQLQTYLLVTILVIEYYRVFTVY